MKGGRFVGIDGFRGDRRGGDFPKGKWENSVIGQFQWADFKWAHVRVSVFYSRSDWSEKEYPFFIRVLIG